MKITVTARGGNRWQVEVRNGRTTSHDVGIPPGYAEKLGLVGVLPERLVEESFRFLLERESNSSILRTFDLPVIGRYFPDYESEIVRRVQH